MASPVTRALLAALAVLTAYVAGVWGFVLLAETGDQSSFQALGLGLTSAFIFAHLLGAGAGGMLWHRRAFAGRVGLFVKGATIYFVGAAFVAFVGMALVTSLINALYG